MKIIYLIFWINSEFDTNIIYLNSFYFNRNLWEKNLNKQKVVNVWKQVVENKIQPESIWIFKVKYWQLDLKILDYMYSYVSWSARAQAKYLLIDFFPKVLLPFKRFLCMD